MKRCKACCLFVAVMIAFFSLIAPISEVFASTGMDLTMEIKCAIEKEASMANSVLTEMVYEDAAKSEEDIIWPDYFGGTYVDDKGRFHVCLPKTIKGSEVAKIKGVLSDFKKIVVFEYREYSFEAMRGLAELANEQFIEAGCTVYASGVSIANNSLIISVDEQSYDNAWILAEDIAENLNVNIKIEKSGQPMSQSSTSGTDVLGGESIYVNLSQGKGYVSLGATGTYNGANAFITSGHGMSTNKSVYLAKNGSKFGTIKYLRFANNMAGDFSIGTLDAGFNPTHKVGTATPETWNGVVNLPSDAIKLKKFGASGKLAYAQVVTVGVTLQTVFSNGESISIKNMVCAKLTSGSSLHGDSGGPYWDEKNRLFYGIHSYYDGAGKNVYITPYSIINNAGFTVFATHNGTWKDYDTTRHRRYCSLCKAYVYESHANFYNQSLGKCTRCGHTGPIALGHTGALPLGGHWENKIRMLYP